MEYNCKGRLHENSYVDELLYEWFLQKHSERVPINGVILKAQAIQLNRLLSRDETFKASEGWLWRLKVWHGMLQINIEGESAAGDGATARQFPDTI
jgi:hypothetical protein